VATLTALSLPATLSGTLLDANFVADAGTGVSFSSFVHKEGGNFTWTTNLKDTGTRADLDGRLWELKCTLRNGTSVTVSPTAAGEFKSYVASSIFGGTAHLYEWRRVAIAGAEDNDRVWVRVLVQLGATGDREAKFYSWVGRERGESATLETFKCPVMWVLSPAEIRAAETNLTAAKRTRMLIPQVLPNLNGQVGSNTNFWITANYSLVRDITGINLQQLQCWAVYNANNLGGGHRRTLIGRTMDTVGWHKSHYYEGYPYLGTSAYIKTAPVYYPRFAKVFARGRIENDLYPESTYGNTFSAGYPFAVGALTAATDDWWYDVCDNYRTWYQAAVAPTPLASDTTRGNFAKSGAMWFGAVQVINKTSVPESQYHIMGVDVMRALMDRIHSTEHPAVTNAVFHQQSTGKDFLLTMCGPNGIDRMSTYCQPSSVYAKGFGIRYSIYSMCETWQAEFGQPWGLSQFLGAQRSGALSNHWLYESKTLRDTLLTKGYLAMAQIHGGASFYLDFMTGNGATPTYTPGGGDVGQYSITHKHGNNERIAARRQITTEIRALIRSSSSFLNNDPDAMLASESTEEFTGEKLDLTQDGYNFLPGHLQYAEQVIYNPATYATSPDLTLVDYPAASRALTPPIWPAVHHQWSPVGRFGIMPLNIGLATNATYHPSGAFAGMTAAEMIEAHNFAAGSIWANGLIRLYDWDGGNNFPLLKWNGNVTQNDATNDPSDAATPICAYMRTLHQANTQIQAGQFQCAGKMLRPPQVDPASADISKVTNPINACRKLAPLAFRAFPYLYDNANWYATTSVAAWDTGPSFTSGSLAFTVPQILANIFQSSLGFIGLIMTNWSSSAGTWKATINPAHYGAVKFGVYELTLAGALNLLGTSVGSFTLGNVSAPTMNFGAFAARSVRVFVLLPA
jgi:hypothetical protein